MLPLTARVLAAASAFIATGSSPSARPDPSPTRSIVLVVVTETDPPDACKCANSSSGGGTQQTEGRCPAPNQSTMIWQLIVETERHHGNCRIAATPGCDVARKCVTESTAVLTVFEDGLGCDGIAGNGYYLAGTGIATPKFADKNTAAEDAQHGIVDCGVGAAIMQWFVKAPDPAGGAGETKGVYQISTACSKPATGCDT